MSDATINGIRLHYTETGAGDPLLLVMGFGMPGDVWLGSLPFLGGFRAVYYDNRGTGQSDKPQGPYTIPQMADDAAGLLDHLQIERAHVYGVSMGGMIAQELVLRHPQKVRSLVLGCTMCGGEHSHMPDPQVMVELIAVISGIGKMEPGEWVDRQLPLIFTKEWVAANPAVRELLIMMAPMLPPTPPETIEYLIAGAFNWSTHNRLPQMTAPETIESLIGGGFSWSTYDRLPQITAPTLIIHGDKDVLVPVDNAYVLAERIPGATLHIVSGAGHGYPAHDPGRTHQVVTDFLRAH